MIELPRRSVTRFFIPLIDVLTLMFCIFLLMPLVQATDGETDSEVAAPAPSKTTPDSARLTRERQELLRLRQERRQWQDLERVRDEKSKLEDQLAEISRKKVDALQGRLAVRVLEIGDEGRLFWYDPSREKDRRIELTKENVGRFIANQKQAARMQELYFLMLYPRPANGNPTYPLRSQREEYDRWFQGVAHGYDIR